MTESPFRFAVSGALGRMGRRLLALADEVNATIVAAVDRDEHAGQTLAALGAVPAGQNGATVTVTSELPADCGAEVCIDFTLPDATTVRARECASHGIALVSGTTGGDGDMQAALDLAAARVPVMLAPNYSLGVALMVELTRRAVEVLGPQFECEIVELHHSRKVDAPSGTAMALAHAAAAGAKLRLDDVACYGRHGHTGEREGKTIGVHAVRGGDVVGEHTVHLFGPSERLELTHKAASRDIFVRGALRTARWLKDQAAGRYTIQQFVATL